MKLFYPVADSRQYYERNAITRLVSFYQAATGPHAYTQRLQYSVPAGRRAFLQAVYMTYQRVTIAAPVGLYGISLSFYINAGLNTIKLLQGYKNVANDMDENTMVWNMLLQAGDAARLYTVDGSTGGTVTYSGALAYVEFDA